MEHGYFKDRISAYYDNNLKPEERVIVEEHLKECEECRQLLAEFEKLDRLVEEHSQLGGEEYWEESARKIEKSLGFEKAKEITKVAPSSWFGLTWKLAAVAASVVFLTIVGVHRDEIWHEINPEKKHEAVPAYVPPVDTSAEAMTDELKQTEPAGVDKDLADREEEKMGKSEQAEQPGETVSREVETPAKGSRIVTPVVPEPAETETAPAPSLQEKSRAMAEQTSKGAVTTTKLKPTVADNQLSQEVNKADEETALSEKITTEKETVSENLAELRQQKDSLSRLMVSEGRWRDKKGLAQSFAGTESKKKVKRTPADIENELLQTCYKIALLTEDKEEYRSVREIIEKVAGDRESPNRELAQSYLKQLPEKN